MIESNLNPGDIRVVTADAASEGYVFEQWTGDTQYLTDPLASETTITMPNNNVEVTASYTIYDPTTITLGGKTYSSIIIGTKRFINENLQFDDGLGGIYNPNNDIGNIPDYGKLYNIAAMLRIKALLTGGWRILNMEDGEDLYVLGQNAIIETGTTHWIAPNTTATNSTGFTGRPAGLLVGTPYAYVGFGTVFLLGLDDSINSIYYGLTIYTSAIFSDTYDTGDGLSLRLAKDI